MGRNEGSSFLEAGSGWHRKGLSSSPEEACILKAVIRIRRLTDGQEEILHATNVPFGPYVQASHSHQESQEQQGPRGLWRARSNLVLQGQDQSPITSTGCG